jgi:hypothetical protein
MILGKPNPFINHVNLVCKVNPRANYVETEGLIPKAIKKCGES